MTIINGTYVSLLRFQHFSYVSRKRMLFLSQSQEPLVNIVQRLMLFNSSHAACNRRYCAVPP